MNLAISDVRKFWIFLVGRALGFFEGILFLPKLEKALSKFLERGSPLVVIDVGANRGQSLSFFQKMFSSMTYIGFEPQKHVFKALSERYSSCEGVILENLAIGNRTGSVTFYESHFDETSSLILPEFTSRYHKLKSFILLVNPKSMFKELVVDITTLDQYCIENRLSRIDLLKIDVEGSELDVLIGASGLLSEGKIKVIQLERHEDSMRPKFELDIETLLSSFNFTHEIEIKHSFGNFYEDIYTFSKPN
jgi:FkbM family methyltransferase